MGQLFSSAGAGGKGCSFDVYLNFKDAKPTPEEKEVFDQVSSKLHKYPSLLNSLEDFNGCQDVIQKHIQDPSNTAYEDALWKQLVPAVGTLYDHQIFAVELNSTLPLLLEALCTEEPLVVMDRKQALTKLFAEIFYFLLRYDELKMKNASIQNIFPIYRRVLAKRNGQVRVNEEMTNNLSIYFSPPCPMLTHVIKTVKDAVKNNTKITMDNVTNCLHILSLVCQDMIETPDSLAKLKQSESTNFVMRVMVSVIILYDHLDVVGAFARKSPIDVRRVYTILKDPQHRGSYDDLISALKYRTKHLKDADTPAQTKKMFE